MLITVDCNSDRIEIIKGNQTIEMECKYPNNVIKILVELINLLGTDSDSADGITIEKIDEDHRTIVEEW